PHAGRVKPGDVVLSLDGKDAAGRVRAAEDLVSGATPQFRRYRALQDLCNGPAGQPVRLEFQTPPGGKYPVTLEPRPSDDSPLRGPGLRERRLPRVAEPKPGVLYVDLDRCSSEEFWKEVLPKLGSARGVVFDVRGYPQVDVYLLGLLATGPLKCDHF